MKTKDLKVTLQGKANATFKVKNENKKAMWRMLASKVPILVEITAEDI